jgi:hypothetical protein
MTSINAKIVVSTSVVAATLAFALALTATPTYAQAVSGSGSGDNEGMISGARQHQMTQHKTEPDKPKVDEKAYDAALKSVPDKKSDQKRDPWGGVR